MLDRQRLLRLDSLELASIPVPAALCIIQHQHVSTVSKISKVQNGSTAESRLPGVPVMLRLSLQDCSCSLVTLLLQSIVAGVLESL